MSAIGDRIQSNQHFHQISRLPHLPCPKTFASHYVWQPAPGRFGALHASCSALILVNNKISLARASVKRMQAAAAAACGKQPQRQQQRQLYEVRHRSGSDLVMLGELAHSVRHSSLSRARARVVIASAAQPCNKCFSYYSRSSLLRARNSHWTLYISQMCINTAYSWNGVCIIRIKLARIMQVILYAAAMRHTAQCLICNLSLVSSFGLIWKTGGAADVFAAGFCMHLHKIFRPDNVCDCSGSSSWVSLWYMGIVAHLSIINMPACSEQVAM